MKSVNDRGENKVVSIYREQLLTINDMESFKINLFQELKKILAECANVANKKWYKSYEVKKLLGISSGTLQNLRVNGTLPFTKIGGVILYSYEDLERMLNSHKRR